AGWNRGTFAGDTDTSNYYQEPQKEGEAWTKPYNEYAKWIHDTLGCDVYAFSTDDHQNHGGFIRCTESKELVVTWCPAD
ncbi:MAG: hypothetical protein GY854_08940, partial [Deltaproteobacteria bacterium]|nr:hypothetical protein [Deltaproteobacteria bacterium]